jgi:hypothetical protein
MRSAVIVDTDILIDLAHDDEVAIKCLQRLEKDYYLEISGLNRIDWRCMIIHSPVRTL